MKKRIWLLAVALLLCGAAAFAVPQTLAYIVDHSNTVNNSFRVEYLPPQDVTVPVRVHKTVQYMGEEGIGPAGFSFRLVNLTTGEVTSMTSFTDGWASANLTFTADDAGKTYNYQLYEYNSGREHVIYDETVYDVTIELRLNQQHEMVPVLTMNGQSVTEITAEFVNFYEAADIPETGDHDQPLMWLALLLLSTAGLCVMGCKERRIRRL